MEAASAEENQKTEQVTQDGRAEPQDRPAERAAKQSNA